MKDIFLHDPIQQNENVFVFVSAPYNVYTKSMPHTSSEKAFSLFLCNKQWK